MEQLKYDIIDHLVGKFDPATPKIKLVCGERHIIYGLTPPRIMLRLVNDFPMTHILLKSPLYKEPIDNIKNVIKDICGSKKHALLHLKNNNNFIRDMARIKLDLFSDINIPFINVEKVRYL